MSYIKISNLPFPSAVMYTFDNFSLNSRGDSVVSFLYYIDYE